MSDFDLLPPVERIEYYRRHASDALRQAGLTPDQQARESFLRLAAGWHSLAAELEKLAEQLAKAEIDPMAADPSPARV